MKVNVSGMLSILALGTLVLSIVVFASGSGGVGPQTIGHEL